MSRVLDQLPLLIGLAAAALLGAALAAEYVFDLRPCVLCLYQRWPHGLAAVLGLATLAVAPGWARAGVTALMGLVLAGGALIAGFHVGVEAQWWEGLPGCSSTPLDPNDMSAAVDQLLATAVVRCDEVAFRFLGLSMAGWNLLASLGLAGAAAYAVRRMIGRARPAGQTTQTAAGGSR